MIILLWIYILNQIVLFGAEISKVYAMTLGLQLKQDLPKTAEKVTKPIEKTSEKIKEATKGRVARKPEEKVESPKQGENRKSLSHRQKNKEKLNQNQQLRHC
jgi:hypothetical protein